MLKPAVDAFPLAEYITGFPSTVVALATVADRTFAPPASVQLSSVATPDELVIATSPVMEPTVATIWKVTCAPTTGSSSASRTMTDGAIGTGVFGATTCALPPLSVIVAGTPGTAGLTESA